MTDTDKPSPNIRMRIVYADVHLIKIETTVTLPEWRGIARAYTSAAGLHEQAIALDKWSRNLRGPFSIEVGADTGIGWTMLRFYTIDMADHVMCQVQLATSPSPENNRPEQVWRLSAELLTEPGLIEAFSRNLKHLISPNSPEATLLGVVD